MTGMAIAEQARRFTYCLTDDSGEAKLGTAVAIRVKEHFFLATAAHVVQGGRNIRVLVRNQIAWDVSDFVARHYDNRRDVGLLELSLGNSHRFEFLTPNRLCLTIDEEQELPVMVVGFPGQFCAVEQVDLTTDSLLQFVACNTLSFHTALLPRSKWPIDGLLDTHGGDAQLADGLDMLIDYEPEHEVKPFTPKTIGNENAAVQCTSLDPRGMSGGGIWLAQITETRERLSYPDVCLIGLQVGWYPRRNLLHGIRIGGWFDLLRERYPELGEALRTLDARS
jgi:hypothetical protein